MPSEEHLKSVRDSARLDQLESEIKTLRKNVAFSEVTQILLAGAILGLIVYIGKVSARV